MNKRLIESNASQSLWNPKHRTTDKNGNAEPLNLPADTQFVGIYIQQSDRDAANDRLNAMIHAHHVKLGNAVADDESGEESEN